MLTCNFYPRPPRGGRHLSFAPVSWMSYFYPRPPRGGRLATALIAAHEELISIHALREEGDRLVSGMAVAQRYFYPRPPRGGRLSGQVADGGLGNFYPRPPRGGRLRRRVLRCRPVAFLSTPSARRATAKTETKSLFSNKLYNILHEFRRALIYNGSKDYPNHAK